MTSPVALITGAGKGIGRSAARLLADAGYDCALVSRTSADLDAVAAGLGPGAFVAPADVADPVACTLAVARTVERFGRLDALVHCAGLAPVATVEEMSAEEWRRVIDTNLSSAFYLAKACWPVFRQQGGGTVVNVSSEAARDPFEGFAAYGAAKAGLNVLGRVLAKQGQPLGIRVHTVAPAAVETGMFRLNVSPEQWPTEKCLAPDDVARVIVDCVAGSLRYTSGDVVWVHKTL